MQTILKTNRISDVTRIEFHADDFGLFPKQSSRIIDCHTQGNLNGISIMPNSEYLDECMELLKPHKKDIEVTVHLNLIEGKSVCDSKELPLLTNSKGILCGSFSLLLIHSFTNKRMKYLKELKKELRAQIHAVQSRLPIGTPLRLDGHAHYHMIPVVFDALMEIVREDQLDVSYIRFPREYLSLYFRHRKELRDLAAINFVKVSILNLLVWRNKRKYSDRLKSMTQKLFLGVFLSGSMYRENVAPLLPDAIDLAKKKKCGIEVLAHPGGVFEPNDITKITHPDDIFFLANDYRRKEATMFEIGR